MTVAASFFLVLARILSRGGSAAGVGASQSIWYPTGRCVRVHLLELFVRAFGLSKSGGFITWARENEAKGGALLDKVPL
jgi:hypothetical protein